MEEIRLWDDGTGRGAVVCCSCLRSDPVEEEEEEEEEEEKEEEVKRGKVEVEGEVGMIDKARDEEEDDEAEAKEEDEEEAED
jgi:hypothetical protein